MFLIVLLAIIGAMLNAGVGYWIIFGLHCFVWLCAKLVHIGERYSEKEKQKKTGTIELTEEGRKYFKLDK